MEPIIRQHPWWIWSLAVLLLIQVGFVLKLVHNIHVIEISRGYGTIESQDEIHLLPLTVSPAPSALEAQPMLQEHHTASDQSTRLKLARDVCSASGSSIPGDVEAVFVYEAEKVAYCSTHKVASTYWVRLFRWLYNDTGRGHVPSPLNISKLDTHLTPLRRLRVRDVFRDADDRALVESSYRFLFTREPFARLWSVYVDKFLLPDDSFWEVYSPRIKQVAFGGPETRTPETWHKTIGRIHPDLPGSTKNETDPFLLNEKISKTRKKLPRAPTKGCYDVPFPEFLQYIIYVAKEQSGKAMDDHFRPVHYGCNPCLFRPDFIGKIETMKQDSLHVLRRMRLDDALIDTLSTSHVQHEISMLIEFNFELVVKRRRQRECVTNGDLERRLIKAFIINGYIPEDSETLLAKRLPLGQETLEQVVLKLYSDSNRTSSEIRQQRERMKSDAYAGISLDVLRSLQRIFYWDFRLFGYDPQPPEIFGSG